MDITDIIYATTCKEQKRACNVSYSNGTTDIIMSGIGELYNELCQVSNRGRYFMIDRSSFICENNIIMINPSKKVLVMAFDSLNIPHKELSSFSDDVLRRLRNAISE